MKSFAWRRWLCAQHCTLSQLSWKQGALVLNDCDSHHHPGSLQKCFFLPCWKRQKSGKRRKVAALSSGLRQRTQEDRLRWLPSQSAGYSPGTCLGLGGVDVGVLGAKEGQRMEGHLHHPLQSFHPTFLHLLWERDLGLHINKTMEFLFLFLINYIIQTLKHL